MLINVKLKYIKNVLLLADDSNVTYKFLFSLRNKVLIVFSANFPISSISLSRNNYNKLLEIQKNESISSNKKTSH